MSGTAGPTSSEFPVDQTKTHRHPPPRQSAHPAMSQSHVPPSMSFAAKSDDRIYSPPATALPSSATATDSPAHHYPRWSATPADTSSHPPPGDTANTHTGHETAPHPSRCQTPSH